jgi:hypothetical protein
MNASMASFQFTGRRQAYHHSARIDSTLQASSAVAAGSRQVRTDGASGSRLIQAQPPQISQRTGRRSSSSADARLCSAKLPLRGTFVLRPSGA